MPARTLPGLGLTGYWDLKANGWKPGMDANLRLLSAFAAGSVKSRSVALPGTPALGDIYIVEPGDATNPNKLAIWDGEAGAEAWNYYAPADGWSFSVADSREVVRYNATIGAWLAQNVYDVPCSFPGKPTGSEVLARYAVARDIRFPAGFAGSVGTVETNPTAAATVDVRAAGASIGTVSISTGGVVTFSTVGGTAKTVAVGAKLTFVAQASADATLAGLAVTLAGVVT